MQPHSNVKSYYTTFCEHTNLMAVPLALYLNSALVAAFPTWSAVVIVRLQLHQRVKFT